jgi:ABC-2 type transport system permease protein
VILTLCRAYLRIAMRDRGALVLGFLLPAVVFVIFAEIFSGATGANRAITVAVADERRSPHSSRLLSALRDERSLRLVEPGDAASVHRLVESGRADAGLILRRDGRSLDELAGEGRAPLAIVVEPTRAVAADLLAAAVQRVYFRALPDAALGGVLKVIDPAVVELTEAQRSTAAEALAGMAATAGSGDDSLSVTESLTERTPVSPRAAAVTEVAYYAGGVAMLFVLLSAVPQATGLIEDRESGLLDRALAGPGGSDTLVLGRLGFLGVQSLLQTGLMFAIAWLGYGVGVPAHLGGWLVITAAMTLAAAGLSLGLATLCRTPRQAQTLLTVAALVASAVGGSMVPRFLMPEWLQHAGWATPTTWALEGYSRLFQASVPAAWLWPSAMLASMGAAGVVLALARARRWDAL